VAIDIIEVIEIGMILRLVESGKMDRPTAEKLVIEFTNEIKEGYGSDAYFIKRGFRSFPPSLVAQIKARYTGRNDAEIQKIYNMSRSTFYRLIKN
jgi:Mor family transcriptional regulator